MNKDIKRLDETMNHTILKNVKFTKKNKIAVFRTISKKEISKKKPIKK
ncbi:hypothetical protein [Mesobacillus boroniphilus]|nr:hypothetical protein [Mesobacillus boroniphilus]